MLLLSVTLKKITVLAICLLFVLAGFFGVSALPVKTVHAEFPGDPPEPPPTTKTMSELGLTMSYTDPTHNSVQLRDEMIVFYNTTANLAFMFNNEAAEDHEIQVFITRPDGERDEAFDAFDEHDRQVFYWDYRADSWANSVGEYVISISIIETVEDEEEIVHPFSYTVICKSAPEPKFGASIRDGNRHPHTETSRFATRTNFELRARATNESFHWNGAEATYTTDCEFLTEGEGGKYLILRSSKSGRQTVTFTVTFDFVEVSETGVPTTVSRSEDVSLQITFFNRPRQPTIWDVLIGVGVLGALAGAAYLMTKLSKNVEE